MGSKGMHRLRRLLARHGLASRSAGGGQKGGTFGDLLVGGFLIEEKETSEVYPPVALWWRKVCEEAGRLGRRPALVITFLDDPDPLRSSVAVLPTGCDGVVVWRRILTDRFNIRKQWQEVVGAAAFLGRVPVLGLLLGRGNECAFVVPLRVFIERLKSERRAEDEPDLYPETDPGEDN